MKCVSCIGCCVIWFLQNMSDCCVGGAIGGHLESRGCVIQDSGLWFAAMGLSYHPH